MGLDVTRAYAMTGRRLTRWGIPIPIEFRLEEACKNRL